MVHFELGEVELLQENKSNFTFWMEYNCRRHKSLKHRNIASLLLVH